MAKVAPELQYSDEHEWVAREAGNVVSIGISAVATDALGDCEDFQLQKRKRLRQAGLPQRAMLMTVVLDENNEGHAVLMVRTDRGDLILDNKRNAVLSWQQTGYVFVKRESQVQTGWVSLAPATGVMATATAR